MAGVRATKLIDRFLLLGNDSCISPINYNHVAMQNLHLCLLGTFAIRYGRLRSTLLLRRKTFSGSCLPPRTGRLTWCLLKIWCVRVSGLESQRLT